MSTGGLGGSGMTMAPSGWMNSFQLPSEYGTTSSFFSDPLGGLSSLFDSGTSSASAGWDNLGGQGQSDLITGAMDLFGGLFGDSAAQEQAEKQFELQKQMFEFNKGNAMYGRDTDAWKWDRQQASNAGQTPGGDFAARPQLNDYV